jgi:hypothetical protein
MVSVFELIGKNYVKVLTEECSQNSITFEGILY